MAACRFQIFVLGNSIHASLKPAYCYVLNVG